MGRKDHEKIERLGDDHVHMVTIQIFYLLKKILPTTEALFKVLSCLLPSVFPLPDDGRALARYVEKLDKEKVRKSKKKSGKLKLEEFFRRSFFDWVKENYPPTVSGPCPTKGGEHQLQSSADLEAQSLRQQKKDWNFF